MSTTVSSEQATVEVSFPKLGWIRFSAGDGMYNRCDLMIKRAAFIWKCVKKHGNYVIVPSKWE